MGKCTTLYLDTNGNMHPAYYKVFKHSGHRVALKSYLAAMESVISSNMQRGGIESLLEMSRKVEADKDKKIKDSKGGPSRSKKMVGKFDGVEAIQHAKEIIIYEHAMSQAEKTIPNHKQLMETFTNGAQKQTYIDSLKDKAREYFKSTPQREEELDKNAKSIVQRWKDEQVEKSEYHKIVEHFVRYRTKKLKNSDLSSQEITEKYLAQEKLPPLATKIIEDISKFFDKELKHDPNIQIMPELGIDVDGWNNRGFIDLFVHYPSTGKTVIYDYKFYNEKSYNEYRTTQKGMLNEPANTLRNNNESLNAIQMSEYRRMLEEYGITDVEMVIIPFVLKIDEDESTIDTTVYQDVNLGKVISVSYDRNTVEAILEKKGINIERKINSRKIEGKISDAASLIEDIRSTSKFNGSTIKAKTIESIKIERDDQGNQYFYDAIQGKRIKLQGQTEEENKAALQKYLKLRETFKVKLADEVINFILSGAKEWNPTNKNVNGEKKAKTIQDYLRQAKKETLEGGDTEAKRRYYKELQESIESTFNKNATIESSLRQLFYGINRDEYTLEALQNDIRFQDVNNVIIKATNKVTGAIRLFGISPGSKGSMQFQHDNRGKYTTVLGNYINNKQANLKNVKRKDRQFDMELMSMGAIMKEMKFDDPKLTFDPPKVGILKGAQTPSRSMSMAELDQIVTALGEVIPKENISEKYKKVLSVPLINKGQSAENYAAELMDVLENSPNLLRSEVFRKQVGHVLADLQDYRLGLSSNYSTLLSSLIQLKRNIDKSYNSKAIDGDRTREAFYIKVNNMIMALSNMDPLLNKGDKDLTDSMLRHVTSMGNINHQYFNYVNDEFKRAKLLISEGYWNRKVTHDRLVKAYMKSEGVTRNSLNKKMKKDLFRKLFKDTELKTPEARLKDLMILKDPKDAHSPEAKALIEHMAKSSDEMMEMYMGKQEFAAFKISNKYQKGMMPVQRQTRSSAAEEGTSKENFLQRWKTNLIGRKEDQREERDMRFHYDISNPFGEQMSNPGTRFEAAGLDATDGEYSNPDAPFELEYNLDVLFENMVLNTLAQKHYDHALAIKSAAEVALIVQDNAGDVRTTVLQKMLNDFTELIVFEAVENPFDENGTVIKRTSSIASKLILGGSPSYMMMETTINLLNLGAEATNQYITQVFTKGEGIEKDFGAKELLKAAKLVMSGSDLTYSLAVRYGMIVRDPSKLKDQRFRQSQSNILNDKALFWANALPLEISQTIVLIASMMYDGSFDAHSLDKDGQLVYDETKDRRFFPQPGEKLTELEKKKRELKFQFYKDQLVNEEGIDPETGKLTRALTLTDITKLHTITTERFASLSADQKVLAETTALGIAFMRFKNWMVAKKEVFWKQYNPDAQLKKNLKWVEVEDHPEGGYFTYVGEPSEGIFNSLYAVSVGWMLKGKNGGEIEGMNLTRKKNMARLVNDALMTGMIYWLFTLLFQKAEEMHLNKDGQLVMKEVPRGEINSTVHRILGNAVMDLTFIYPVYQALLGRNSNIVPVAGVGQRIGLGIIGMGQGVLNLDYEQVLASANSVFRISGAYRGVSDLVVPGVKKMAEK